MMMRLLFQKWILTRLTLWDINIDGEVLEIFLDMVRYHLKINNILKDTIEENLRRFKKSLMNYMHDIVGRFNLKYDKKKLYEYKH
jgi:hypothetical protein